MARHSGKPSAEKASRKAPRTLTGTANTKNEGTRRFSGPNNHTNPDNTHSNNEQRQTASDTSQARHTNHAGHATHGKHHNPDTATSHDPHNFSGSNAFFDAIEQGIKDGNARVNNQVKFLSRRIVIAAVAIVAIVGICFGWIGIQGSQRMHELAEINSCKEATTAMTISYSKAFQLKARVTEAFTSFDSSYDLDKLAELHKTEVQAPTSIDCSTNIKKSISKTKEAKTAYDKQIKEFKAGLKKIEAEEQTK